nr:type IV pilus modification protein PilV [uncultured Albidiferax sp.]
MPRRPHAPSKGHLRRDHGVTLVEVLVAILILSIGLLGMAGLQLATAKYKLSSGARASLASLYADYADRVRINTESAGINSISGGGTASLYTYRTTWAAQQAITSSSMASSISAVACEGSSACTSANRAAYDMLTWRKSVRDNLPQGSVYVVGDRRDGINITFMWFDKDSTTSSSRTDDGTGNTLTTAASCSSDTATGTESGLAQQTCCPAPAAAPAGVRCVRFSFMP